jgi:hypothetical protein
LLPVGRLTGWPRGRPLFSFPSRLTFAEARKSAGRACNAQETSWAWAAYFNALARLLANCFAANGRIVCAATECTRTPSRLATELLRIVR